MALFGQINSSTDLKRQVVLVIDQFRSGVTAPTDVTIGTTPTIPALRFAATNELISIYTAMPFTWDKGDVEVILVWSLVSAEVNADQLSVTMDYNAPRALSTGNGLARASTQLTNNLSMTTANGLAAGDIYAQTFDVLAADATNPLANAQGLAMEFHLTNTTGVASADLIAACINYTATY